MKRATQQDVAVVGMAGRFPGAQDVAQFWKNLRDGIETISFYSEDELLDAGVAPSDLKRSNYVRAAGTLEGIELFDAGFFGLNPKDAERMDPQQRLLLEIAWAALESAGYGDERERPSTGVYATAGFSAYHVTRLLNTQNLHSTDNLQVFVGNLKDFIATRISYHLNLRGPSVSVQTACSSSLVAIHMACRGLWDNDCDLALAGAVSLPALFREGYLYEAGAILSPDGHCRAFDAEARGTVWGNGAGAVVLKRLQDAKTAGDTILAVIKGTAINNDGAAKAGYTAPSVEGQASVIRDAHRAAGVDPDEIDYVEAHGTGTALGDVVEISALNEAFGSGGNQVSCAIGSVKTNIGHLDCAAGMAGLIKTILALRHREIPPNLHYSTANPEIDYGRFAVSRELSVWKNGTKPRRAGISAFGIGGTNAHAVVEEAPEARPSGPSRRWQLIALSARSADALNDATDQLAEHVEQTPQPLPDLAYTLQTGRTRFDHGRVTIIDHDDAPRLELAKALREGDSGTTFTGVRHSAEPPVVFLFPGQGSQASAMGAELYRAEPEFAKWIDLCADHLRESLCVDLQEVLATAPGADHRADHGADHGADHSAVEYLSQTAFTQPALFAIEFALAKLWESWGVRPTAMIGHSLGEYVAACLAGVFSLEDCLKLVAARGQMMQTLHAGDMLAVAAPAIEIETELDDSVSLAASNSPSQCVVSGERAAVRRLHDRLCEAEVGCRTLSTSHAFHSRMMDPILDEFAQLVARFDRRPPTVPFVSNVSGDWISADQAVDPSYWSDHLRRTVRFDAGVRQILARSPRAVFLEVGPGRVLTTLVAQQTTSDVTTISSLSDRSLGSSEQASTLAALGRLWLTGVPIDWPAFYRDEARQRIPAPTYAFERERYWVEASREKRGERESTPTDRPTDRDTDEWLWSPQWIEAEPASQRTATNASTDSHEGHCWLLFTPSGTDPDVDISRALEKELIDRGELVATVEIGPKFEKRGPLGYVVDPFSADDYETVIADLRRSGHTPRYIYHLWNLECDETLEPGCGDVAIGPLGNQLVGFTSLMDLARSLGVAYGNDESIDLVLVTRGLHRVTPEDTLREPLQAASLGPCRVIPREYPGVECRNVDLPFRSEQQDPPGDFIEREVAWLISEATARDEEAAVPNLPARVTPYVAYRGETRWLESYAKTRTETSERRIELRPGGSYLITGGLGGIGLALAKHIAQRVRAKLILTGRSSIPHRSEWDQLLEELSPEDRIHRAILSVRELESLGAEVYCASADVTDAVKMEEVVRESERRFGDIHGVVHAAGVPGGGAIQLRERSEAEAVLAPKVLGTLTLESVFQNRPLDFLALCSGLAAVAGGFGQADYCAANAFLDVFAQHRRQAHPVPRTPVISIGWDAWRDVGMAVDTASWRETGRKPGSTPRVDAQPTRPTSAEKTDSAHPSRSERHTSIVSAPTFWPLREHRMGHIPVVPAAALVDLVLSKFRSSQPVDPFDRSGIELRDVFFSSPVVVHEGEQRELRIDFHPTSGTRSGEMEFTVSSVGPAVPDDISDHVRGRVAVIPEGPNGNLADHSLDRLLADQSWRDLPPTEYPYFGPRWQSVSRRRSSALGQIASIELPKDYLGDLEDSLLHPALFDVATSYPLSGHLPVAYRRVRCYAPLPAKVLSHASIDSPQSTTESSSIATYDVTLWATDGQELASIEGYTSQRASQEEMLDIFEPRPNGSEPSNTTDTRRFEDESSSDNFAIVARELGNIETLRPQSVPRREPGPYEVEIHVAAAGLNFKDVLIASGMISVEAAGVPADTVGFGGECSGRVTRVGSHVERFAAGDEVIAIAPTCFSRFTCARHELVAPIPSDLDFDSATTIPMAFLTSYYSLVPIARLAAGERVLIHAASGGVGLAAVQIAKWCGAEIFATAGSPEKRKFLRSLGIDHVMDSRSLGFAEETRDRTQGEGVDVILNSLAGPFMTEGLDLLREYGRFVELGKRDLLANSKIGLRPFDRCLSFFAIDLGHMVLHRRAMVQSLLGEITELFDQGSLEALPHQRVPMREAHRAFSKMARAEHMGKIVLTNEQTGRSTSPVRPTIENGKTTLPGKGDRPPAGRLTAEHVGLQIDLERAISPAEGARVFDRILSLGQPYVVVSTRGLGSQSRTDSERPPRSLPEAEVEIAPTRHEEARHPRPSSVSTDFVAPADEIEQRVADAWQKIFWIEEVGTRDDFFDLGGHSLMVPELLTELREVLDVDLPVATVFQHPTVADLAEVIRQRQTP